MIVLPAIDIADGRVVRADGAARDPAQAVRRAYAAGATWVHLVDMDRAYGRGRNDAAIRAALAEPGGTVQLGGGLLAAADVREAAGWGVGRIVLGLEVLLGGDAGAVVAAAGTVPLAVNVDLRNGRVWPRGAPAPLATPPEQLVDRAVSAGIRTVVCRDLARDGALAGADLDTAARLLGRGADVIAAGGVAALAELERARALGLAGIIVGRAIQAGRFALTEALAWSG